LRRFFAKLPVGIEQSQAHVPYRPNNRRRIAVADTAGILAQGHIQPPMLRLCSAQAQAIFDFPMPARRIRANGCEWTLRKFPPPKTESIAGIHLGIKNIRHKKTRQVL